MFNDKYGLTQVVLEGRKTMARRIWHSEQKQKYNVGEIVAIAQSYKDSGYSPDGLEMRLKNLSIRGFMKDSAGWNNKLFVRADSCKHHIKITNIKVERLQDISEKSPSLYAYDAFLNGDKYFASRWFNNPHEAFSKLIDKVSGKGTWDENPFVWVYEFEVWD